MSFQLIIRNNLKDDADSFAASLVGVFPDGRARVGTDEDCDCQVLDSRGRGGQELWFEITEHSGIFHLHRHSGHEVYVNSQILTEPAVELTSGDSIRVEHWTFRFQKIHPRASSSSRADWSAKVSKAVIMALIAIQLLAVLWLPDGLDYERIVGRTILEQETVLLLDQNRRRVRRFPLPPDELSIANAVVRIVATELDHLALYLRRHSEQIPHQEWVVLNEDLDSYRMILDLIERDEVPVPLPDLAVDQAVRAVIESARFRSDSRNEGK